MTLRQRWRTAFIGTVAAVAVLALGACAPTLANTDGAPAPTDTALSGQKVTLKMWGWAVGMEDAVDQWNAENPDIQIDFYRMSGDDGDKIPAAIEAGTAPDIIQLDAHAVPNYVIKDYLTDISAFTTGLEDEFTEAAWSEVDFDGMIFAMPQDVGPTGLIYRKDLFARYGVAVPKTWDEYLDAARAIREADPDAYIGQISANEAGFWMEQVIQNGGSWFAIGDDAWQVDVNDVKSQEVAEIWQTLLDEDLVKVVDMWTPEYWKAVNDGQILSMNYAAWFPALLKENAGKLSGRWAVAPSPTFPGSDAAGTAGGSIDAITANSDHPAEAMEFLKWINTTDEGTQFLIDGGVLPASRTGLAQQSLLKPDPYFGGQAINEVFVDAADKVPGTWTDGPTFTQAQDALKDEFAKVVTGKQTFSEALDRVHDKTEQDIKNLSLEVQD